MIQPGHLRLVELVFEPQVWSGTRPRISIHRHLGYVTYETDRQVKIAPEITFSSEHRHLRIGHEETIDKLSIPRPSIFPLGLSETETNIIKVDYEDPSDKVGVLSSEEARGFQASTFRSLGYLVEEAQRIIRIAAAVFEYEDGTFDYETVHVIPKTSVKETAFLRRMPKDRDRSS